MARLRFAAQIAERALRDGNEPERILAPDPELRPEAAERRR
jgi:hypothetical protein